MSTGTPLAAATTNTMRIQDRLKPDTIVKVAYRTDEETDDNLNPTSNSGDDPEYILGYWAIRGLGEPLRMMLSASQVNHWNVMYDCSEVYQADKAWLKKEYNPFMNLPFLVHCRSKASSSSSNGDHGENEPKDRVIAQTNAIFTYLGRQLNMLGKTVDEESKCEELLCEIMDLRNKMVGFAYNSNIEECERDAIQLLQNSKAYLGKFESHLQQKSDGNHNGCSSCSYLVGNQLNAPDFHLYEMLDQLDGLCRTFENVLLKDENNNWRTLFPYLWKFKQSFETLQENKHYFDHVQSSPTLPYNNMSARFGSNPETLGRYKQGQHSPWRAQGVIEQIRPCTTRSITQSTLGKKRKYES